ncbi:6-phosphogluconolactonase [compost metagenome]
MIIHQFETVSALNENLAAFIVHLANKAIHENGRFNFVLTGGSSPKELYHLISTSYKEKVDWNKVFFFFGDERYVAANHPDYNGLMARNYLFDRLQVNPSQVFYIDTTLAPEVAARDYETRLNAHFSHQPIQFDFVLLGMGDDAHTASIFPHTELVNTQEATVAAVWIEKLNSYRISLTAPLINKAKNVAFITFGANKATAVRQIIGNTEKNTDQYPAQLIHPESGQLDWFIDDLAAGSLTL